MSKTINFELTSPIRYANGVGGEVECNHIELREPTGKVSSICMAIEGLIGKAQKDFLGSIDLEKLEGLQEKTSQQPEVNEADSVLSVWAISGVEMDKLALRFKELFKIVAYMGGEKPITEARLNEMSHRDLRQMMGVYAVNFIQS